MRAVSLWVIVLTLTAMLLACGAPDNDTVPPSSPSSSTDGVPEEFGPLPTFRLTLSGSTSEGGTWISEIWYGGEAGSRENCLESANIPNLNAGDFTVFNGKEWQVYHYNAETNTYNAPRTHPHYSMVRCIKWSDPQYPLGFSWKDRCVNPKVTAGPLLADRETLHVHCENFDLWLDSETGLVLKSIEPGMTKEITSIEYNPSIPGGIFEFVPPPGASES